MEPFDLRQWKGFIEAGGDPSNPAIIDQAVIDSQRIHSTDALFIALKGDQSNGHDFIAHSGCKYALVDKNWKGKAPCILLRVHNPLQAFQEIVSHYRRGINANVIAITGSYGKTMVKDLLYALLKNCCKVTASPESFNSQIGVPLSLLKANSTHDTVLIEAGFSYIGETEKLARIIDPDHTILTHVGKKHLTTLGTRDVIAKEMTALLPTDRTQWTISPTDPLLHQYLPASNYYWDQKQKVLPHYNSSLITFPNGKNQIFEKTHAYSYFQDLINLTIKPAYLLGVSNEAVLETLYAYEPEPMRTEIWKTSRGTTLINETYCSDPQSINLALKHFDPETSGKKIFFFGGLRESETSSYSRIGKALGKAKLDQLALIGKEPFTEISNSVLAESPRTIISHYKTFNEAIEKTKEELHSGDTLIIKGSHKPPFDSITESIQGSIFTNQCFINLASIESNIKRIRSKLKKDTRLMVMVKALAYGMHDTQIAKFLEIVSIDILGVSYIDEGINLRENGIKQVIFVLNAAPYEFAKAVRWEFEIAVNDQSSIKKLNEESRKQEKITKVHLHIDTGMSRLGCRPEEALLLANEIDKASNLCLTGVMTHFACADDPDQDNFTNYQTKLFDSAIEKIEKNGISIKWKHACNSRATERFSFTQYNMVRLGLAIYGLCEEGTPAITLTSRIVGMNHCKKGETISYGRNYTVQKKHETIAVIPVGYFDGLHLNYSGKGEVMIHGIRAPMVGKICMDYLMVDVSHIPDIAIGDSVLIFGEDDEGNYLSPEELAAKGGSNIYELISCLGPRIQRIFIYEENAKII